MEEVLDIVRKDYKSANRAYSEEFGRYVEYSDEVVEDKFERFKTLHAIVSSAQYGIKQHFIDIGHALFDLRRDEIYKVVRQDMHGGTGYSNFYIFCGEVFGFKKKTTQRLLKVYEEFCNKENGLIDVRYVNFSFRQLAELAGMEKYRERIPVTMTTRQIQHLKEYYKDNVPREGQSAEDDLKEWQRLKVEEKEKKNAARNSISFIPATKSDKVVGKIEGSARTPVDESLAESDSEDERLLSTPDVRREVSFESIRDGLLRQLELLSGVLGWKGASEVVISALQENRPTMICRTRDVVKLIGKNEELKKAVAILKNKAGSCGTPASGDKLNLKNESERKVWLEGFRSWGEWITVPEVDKAFYRYDFVNGYSLIVEVGMQYPDSWSTRKEPYERVSYSVIDEGHRVFNSQGLSYTAVVQWLTKNSKDI